MSMVLEVKNKGGAHRVLIEACLLLVDIAVG